MTYDCKTNQLLTLKDCLHGKYGDLLNTLGVSEYDKESTSIKVDQDSFTYFTDQKLKNKITVNYKEISLGLFEKYEDAVEARKKAEEKYFGSWSFDNSQKYGGNEDAE